MKAPFNDKMKKTLLIIPSGAVKVYSQSKIKAAVSEIPYISQAMLGAMLHQEGLPVKVLDLSTTQEDNQTLINNTIKEFQPTHVGVTFTTPLVHEANSIAKQIKAIDGNIILIAGGVHPTCRPSEVLEESKFEVCVIGEGDETIVDIVKSSREEYSEIKGIAYKDKNSEITQTVSRPLMENLDLLPFAKWDLYDLSKYKSSPLTSRASPVGAIETSRGCVFACTYCNKKTFSRRFRMKSANRVVDEMEYMLKSGFKEIHIWDDMFTTNLARAKDICDEIVRRKLKFPWCLACGIRVDIVDEEFLKKAKDAGCYSVYFGIESGDDQVLKDIDKRITTAQVRNAVKLAKKVGLETTGFFMVGLPADTKETLEKTIKFARSLPLDYAKCTILVPYPETKIYEQWEEKGFIISRDWSKYNFHTASKVYKHPNISWETLDKYYHKFYRRFYFNPKYIFRKLRQDIRTGRLGITLRYAIKTWGK
jgi:anaerobic magnesium-protoporphyrin IX monomethyl ester cyclase